VRLYRPEVLSVQPVGLRMILEPDVPPDALSSLMCIVSGASHLDPQLQDRFERYYGLRAFGAYGATEFCGSIVVWTDALYDTFRECKRGSVGRPIRGAQIQISDRDTGAVLQAGAGGLIEAKVDRVEPHWIRTTDLGYLDNDGFLFITGRADNAINRGGYKIVPDEVVEALLRHPAVLNAAVVGIPHGRLGKVPVAAIEVKAGHLEPSEEELRDFLRSYLLNYQIPKRVKCVSSLPRNASLKIMTLGVRESFQGAHVT
jgi:long-chain acyl-CoA synthetase